MPRKNTLSHADFIRAEKARLHRERGALFILSSGTLVGQKTPEIKASCVVSKKTAPRAVVRNLIKRRWRVAMRECLSSVPAPSTGAHPYPMCPSVLIFYAMRPANKASFAEIKSDVEALVARASLKLRAS